MAVVEIRGKILAIKIPIVEIRLHPSPCVIGALPGIGSMLSLGTCFAIGPGVSWNASWRRHLHPDEIDSVSSSASEGNQLLTHVRVAAQVHNLEL